MLAAWCRTNAIFTHGSSSIARPYFGGFGRALLLAVLWEGSSVTLLVLTGTLGAIARASPVL